MMWWCLTFLIRHVGIGIGFDVMKYYVKRCIALPGDTFEIRKAQYRVRGVEMPLGKTTSQQELYRRLVSDRESLALRVYFEGIPLRLDYWLGYSGVWSDVYPQAGSRNNDEPNQYCFVQEPH